jgi:DNA-binding HxlR family transcriptional regulator
MMNTMERRSTCPINFSVEIFGDKWMLLILRDLMFNGKNSFLEFRASAEKISSAVLTEKLNLLLEEGIVSKVVSPKKRVEIPVPDHRQRYRAGAGDDGGP